MISPKQLLVTLLLSGILISCSTHVCGKCGNQSDPLLHHAFNNEDQLKRYNLIRDSIASHRLHLLSSLNSGNPQHQILKKASLYLTEKITARLFPFWYGTSWDYNGTTERPGEGGIACGYFVSTVLKHAGFKIEKVKLSQQPASNIIKTLCKKESIKVFGNNREREFLRYMNAQPNGIYLLGLDFHVGYLHKTDSKLHFIHSLGGTGVIREKASESEPIQLSNVHFVGSLSGNDDLMRRWLTGKVITTRGVQ